MGNKYSFLSSTAAKASLIHTILLVIAFVDHVIEMSIRTGSHANCDACFQSLLPSSIIYACSTNMVEGLVKLIMCN